MVEKVSTLEIRGRLGDILNRVSLRHDEFIIERKGKALAAMVPVEKLEQFRKMARLRLLEALTPGARGLPAEQSDALADQAKHQSRERKAR
jgi:prevent-host-death family protein